MKCAEFDPETWANDVDQYFQLIDDPSSLWQHSSSSNHIADIGNCTLSFSAYQHTTLSSYMLSVNSGFCFTVRIKCCNKSVLVAVAGDCYVSFYKLFGCTI